MIRLGLPPDGFYIPCPVFAEIDSLIRAYRSTDLLPDVWMSGECVICKNGGRIMISGKVENTEELLEFLSVIGYSEIFCSKKIADALGLEGTKRTVLHTRGLPDKAFSWEDISLEELYKKLSFGNDGDLSLPDFCDFAADVSHRMRHSAAAAYLHTFGAGLAFMGRRSCVICGVAVDGKFRGQGVGKRIVDELCRYAKGDIFVCADKDNTNFYKKCGFEEKSEVVTIKKEDF